MLEPLWKKNIPRGGGGGAQVGIEPTTSWLLDRRHTTMDHRDCPIAMAGSIHTIAGSTALIYQSMIYFKY